MDAAPSRKRAGDTDADYNCASIIETENNDYWDDDEDYEEPEDESDSDLGSSEDVSEKELSLFYCNLKSICDVLVQQSQITVLNIVGLPLSSLNGIQYLQHLKELLVVKCNLKNVGAVQHCYGLEKLYLYSNMLSVIPDLKNTKNLEVLWLSDNCISSFQNFDTVTNLRELYIDKNNIKNMDNAFVEHQNLEILNISANPIYCLSEVRNLMKLKRLANLFFADPLYFYCPLAKLANYRLFVIYHLPELLYLDGYVIEEDERINAKGFYSNLLHEYKLIYYTQLGIYYENIKSSRDENRRALHNFKDLIATYAIELKQVHNFVKDILKQNKIKSNLHLLPILVKNWENEVYAWNNVEFLMRKIQKCLLEHELQSAGNLNLTRYTGDTEIAAICNNLLETFLCSHTRKEYRIAGIKVLRVTHVKNNSLRLLLTDQNSNHPSKYATCLLANPCPVKSLSDWPFELVQHGFINYEEVTTCVTKCLEQADRDWIKDSESGEKEIDIEVNRKWQEIRVITVVQYPNEKVLFKIRNSGDRVTNKDLLEPQEGGDNESCNLYSICKSHDVFPVFIIEYQYIHEENNLKWTDVLLENRDSDCSSKPRTTKLSQHTLLSFVPNPEKFEFLSDLNLTACNITTFDEFHVLPNVTTLNISCNYFKEISNINILFPNVKNLNLSNNQLQELSIVKFEKLESLNLSWNLIEYFLPMMTVLSSHTPNIQTLEVGHNPFKDVINSKHMCFMSNIYIKNLQKFNDKYIGLFMRKLKPLTITGNLNNKKKKENYCNENIVTLSWKAEMYKAHDKVKQDDFSNIYLFEDNSWICLNNMQIASVQFTTFCSELKWLELSHNYINDLKFLNGCLQLEELSLENNVLQNVNNSIFALKYLVKLNLSENYLIALPVVENQCLPCLKVLNISQNMMKSLGGLESFPALEECYFSSNLIDDEEGLAPMTNCRSLKIINMVANPVEYRPNIFSFIVFNFPYIEFVNGYNIKEADIQEANLLFCKNLNEEFLLKHFVSEDLSKITQLTLSNCGLRKVQVDRESLPALESIDLSYNYITTLVGLHDLRVLKTLCLSGNQVSCMGILPSEDLAYPIFAQLKSLYLDNNDIASLVDLELHRIRHLHYLFLQDNNLRNLQGLQRMRNLKCIILDSNKICSISYENASALSNIEELFLEKNRLRSLLFLRDLRRLQRLFLSFNKIKDLEQLKIIAELNHLEELTLVGNPICRTRTEYSVVLGYIPWMNIYVIPSDSDDEVEDDDEEFDFTSPTRIIELI